MLESLRAAVFKNEPASLWANTIPKCRCGRPSTRSMWWENVRHEMVTPVVSSCDTHQEHHQNIGSSGSSGSSGGGGASIRRRRGGGGAYAGTASEIAERKEIGALMSQWHSSGSDPIYAVGSFYVSGTPYPDPNVVERARDSLAKDLQKAKKKLSGWGPKEVRELNVIIAYLDRVLGKKTTDTADLTTMLAAYEAAAVWTGTDEDERPLDEKYSVDDFTREARTSMMADVKKFAHKNASDIGGHWSQAGHDFWLSRNGHGTGFLDREDVYGAAQAKRLQVAAQKSGGSDVYVGDRKKLHVS